jgi:excisionase family DNA binding protein
MKKASNTSDKKLEINLNAIDEFLTVKELESLLKIDQKTIYRYVACGLIPYVRIQSNIRFIRQQIVIWIEAQNYFPKPAHRSNDKQA